jgi:peptidoglycan/xylan/chitin deacetylase (PgdA/CDA1 family)
VTAELSSRGSRACALRLAWLVAVVLAVAGADNWLAPVSEARVGPPKLTRSSSHALATKERREFDRFVRMGVPLYCGGGRGRYVALTFDDGPGPYTALALRILRRADAVATFFVVGRNLATWPRAARAEEALGAVGDHTWTHAWLPALTARQVESELARTHAALAKSTHVPVRFFRPPYGARTPAIDQEARRLGMLDVLWSIDSRDSEGAAWPQIGETVARDLRPGSIILLHENRGQTVAALRFRILPLLHRLGYRTVTILQLLALDPPSGAELRGRCGTGPPAG